MVTVQKNFRVVAPVNTSKSVDDGDGTGLFYIEGIANSGQEDLVGDIVTEQALTRIVEQAPQRNLHYNHDGRRDDILGTIVESELRSEGAWIKASILSEQAEWLQSYLTQGIKFGLSISGTCDYEEGSISDIIDWQLTEISLTDTPCDPQTMGTVSMSKSFDDCIRAVQKQTREIMEDNNMAEETSNDVKYISEEDAIELINTAFNERKDEFMEAIMKEYDAKFEALEAKVESLLKEDDEDEKPAEEPAEEEVKAEDAPTEEEDEDEDEDEEEKTYTEDELKNILEAEVSKGVEARVKQIFDEVGKSADFQYEATTEEVEDVKKSYTARELAEMGVI